MKPRTVIVTIEMETTRPLRDFTARRCWLDFLDGEPGDDPRQVHVQVAQAPAQAKKEKKS